MSKALVTVVIPCHNKGDVVAAAVDSVLRNTYRPIEIIVIDDGSSDRLTQKTLEALDQYDDVTVYKQKLATGVAKARNLGIKRARGSFILLLDHDDLISSNFIADAVTCLEGSEGIDYVYPDTVFIGEDRRLSLAPDYSPRHMRVINLAPVTCLFRADVLKKYQFRPELPVLEDWDLLLRVSEDGKVGKPLHGIYLFYRIVRSVSRNTHKHKYQDRVRIIKAIRRDSDVVLPLWQRLVGFISFFIAPFINRIRFWRERQRLRQKLTVDQDFQREVNELHITKEIGI